jgi:hypothetical protein
MNLTIDIKPKNFATFAPSCSRWLRSASTLLLRRCFEKHAKIYLREGRCLLLNQSAYAVFRRCYFTRLPCLMIKSTRCNRSMWCSTSPRTAMTSANLPSVSEP